MKRDVYSWNGLIRRSNSMKREEKKIFKHDPEYIAYVNSGESAAVFIVRDCASDIDCKGQWIDVVELIGDKDEYGQWDFKRIRVELFERKIKAEYPKGADKEERRYITWRTATDDIESQKKEGITGPRYELHPKLKAVWIKGERKCKYITENNKRLS